MAGGKLNLITSLSRVYRFSAAHRLHTDAMSEVDNKAVYDKCHNISGHGHDYTLEVTVRGNPDPESGMIISLTEFDAAVNSVLNKLDHRHLDLEVDYFKNNISTGEMIIQYLWNELNPLFPKDKLYHLKLWETNNNYFELGKDLY